MSLSSCNVKNVLDASVNLHRDGVVILNDVFQPSMIQKLREQYMEYLARLEEYLKSQQMQARFE